MSLKKERNKACGRGQLSPEIERKSRELLGKPRLHIKAQPVSVVPDGLRQALSNAGIAAPESDEMLAATCEKYIQMLVTWVKDRKPFQPAPGEVSCG
ncbi:hypothetical protein JR782_004998 [Salmonella enterica subsp. enterica serovar Eastbourne]|nr:hypothetical protein [Salmonella enterica subsp. enterica serovar Eastbourne]EHC5908326.1 hypothetical protein [Salmonella enterica subsp. enterica serovar Eastbourne]EJW4861174.1 hypothetical protein [Salmonella enterica]